MDLDCVLSNGIHGVHICGQQLDVDLDGISSGTGVGLGVSGDDGNGIAELEDLLVTQDGTVPAVTLVVQGQHDQTVDAVLAACGDDVGGGDDPLDAGHLQSLGGINTLNESVGDLGLDQSQPQGAFGHLQSVVSAEVPGTHDLGSCGGTDILGADDGVTGGLEDQVFLGDLSAVNAGSVHNSVNQRLVTGAAAQVAVLLEPVTDFFTGGSIVVVQQDLGGHDEAGGAEATLSAAMSHPGNLQGVHIGNGTDAFNGGDLSILSDLAQLHNAGACNLAVHNDVTGTAVALAAADFTAGQQQTLTQEAGQGLVLAYQNRTGCAVDDECSLDHTVFLPKYIESFGIFYLWVPQGSSSGPPPVRSCIRCMPREV